MWALFALGLVLALVVWAASAPFRKARRFREPEFSTDGGTCWLCGGRVTNVVDDAFQCERCGGLQGSGAQKLRDGKRREVLARLPIEERRRRARNNVEEAKLELIVVEQELRNVLELSIVDIGRTEHDDPTEKVSRFMGVLGTIGRLEQKLVDTATLLAEGPQLDRLSVDVHAAHLTLGELGIKFYGISHAERATHDDIGRAIAHLPNLELALRHLEHKLAALPSPAPETNA